MKEPRTQRNERQLKTKLPKPKELINKEFQHRKKNQSANELHKGNTHKYCHAFML